MSVWLRLKLFSKCSFDLELGSANASGHKMKIPDDFDDTDEEEDVDEDGEDRGNRQEVDAVPLIHPAELVLVHHPKTCR